MAYLQNHLVITWLTIRPFQKFHLSNKSSLSGVAWFQLGLISAVIISYLLAKLGASLAIDLLFRKNGVGNWSFRHRTRRRESHSISKVSVTAYCSGRQLSKLTEALMTAIRMIAMSWATDLGQLSSHRPWNCKKNQPTQKQLQITRAREL